MKLIGIIQARMSSARCPGKVLRLAGGKPLLAHHLNRVRLCRDLSEVYVATSLDPTDDAIAEFCAKENQPCQRGDLHDVAARFSGVLKHSGADAFIRLNGDSPLIDPALIQLGIRLFTDSDAQIVTNVFPRSFPKGQSIEILRADCFLFAEPKMTGPEREHITQYFYERPQDYRILNFKNDQTTNVSQLNLSVDTEEEYRRFQVFAEEHRERLAKLGWRDLLEAYWPETGKVGNPS